MNTNLYYIDNNHAIYPASIIEHDGTQDADSSGYLIQNGTNRTPQSGISTTGALMIWIKTNGNPVVIYEDCDDWALALADIDTPDGEQATQGAKRLLSVIDCLRGIYESEAAAEDLDWYADQANAVIAKYEAEATYAEEA